MSYGYHLCYTGVTMEKRIKAYLLLTEEWLQRENLHRNMKMYLCRLDKLFTDMAEMIPVKA